MNRLIVISILIFSCCSVVKASPITITDAFIERDKLKIFTRNYCKNENIKSTRQFVFVHGLTYSSHEFDVDYQDYSLARYFAKLDYCVWLFDVTGYGRSDRPFNGFIVNTDYAVKDLATVIEHVRSRTGQSSVYLLGWSWGTVVAARFTIKHRELVERLILYAPIVNTIRGPSVENGWHENNWKHAASDFQQNTRGEVDFNIVRQEVVNTFLANCWRFDGKSSPNGARRELLSQNENKLFEIEKLNLPVLFIGGIRDPYLNWLAIEHGFKNLQNNHQNRLIKIPRGSHILMLEEEHYKYFRSSINNFLTDK